MNFFGEMMLYSSFAVICQTTAVWYIYAYVWIFCFSLRMAVKELSLSKKEKWGPYKAKTWLLIPKLYNSTAASMVLYSIFGYCCYYAHTHGGIEAAVKSLLPTAP